jgi:hypothetical protein
LLIKLSSEWLCSEFSAWIYIFFQLSSPRITKRSEYLLLLVRNKGFCVLPFVVTKYSHSEVSKHYFILFLPQLFFVLSISETEIIVTVLEVAVYSATTQRQIRSTLKANSHMPCRARAVPLPCCFSRPRHSAAGERHGMCELTSGVSRRLVGDLPRFGFFRLTSGHSRRLLSRMLLPFVMCLICSDDDGDSRLYGLYIFMN